MEIIDFIKSLKLPLTDEKRLQQTLQDALEVAGWKFWREHRLSGLDIVDFMLPDGTAIECKLRAKKKQIYRQLTRYAKHNQVKSLVLVTNTAMGLPASIKDKPVYYISLGAAWL